EPGSGIEGYSAPEGATQQQNLYDPIIGVNAGDTEDEGSDPAQPQDNPGTPNSPSNFIEVPLTQADPVILEESNSDQGSGTPQEPGGEEPGGEVPGGEEP